MEHLKIQQDIAFTLFFISCSLLPYSDISEPTLTCRVDVRLSKQSMSFGIKDLELLLCKILRP